MPGSYVTEERGKMWSMLANGIVWRVCYAS